MQGDLLLAQDGIYEGIISAGTRLAQTPESEGGWSEYFDESQGLGIDNPVLKAHTAIMLENSKRWLASKCGGRRDSKGRMILNEATRSALVGGFSDHLFPIVRAGFATNVINDLVSVQPTTRRQATVIYWNWIVGSNKGSYVQGQKLFDALTGKQDAGTNFTSELIDTEAVAALGSAGTTISGTLAFNDGGGVRPGTVKVTATATSGGAGMIMVDNGRGAFVSADLTVASSSINYATGAWSITISGDTFTTAATNTTRYRWDSEGSSMLPQVDVQITQSTVETERRGLQLNYSTEAMMDIQQELGQSLEPNLVQGAAEEMNNEVARQLISEMWSVAPVVSTFDITPGTGLTRAEHLRDLVYNLTQASNNIQSRTRKGHGNFLLVDAGAANVLITIGAPLFVKAPDPVSVNGVYFLGTLNGQFKVYMDMNLALLTGASAVGNILMGFKGREFFEAGLVYSPLNALYTTDTTTLANFMAQKGMASRYATKMVNPDLYARVSLSAS